MANTGKFKDRTPYICPAGLQVELESPVKELFNVYPTDDAIEAVLHQGNLKKVPFSYRQSNMRNHRHVGAYTESKDLLNPPVLSRYQTLLSDLTETVKESYWNKDLGKCRDPVGRLPPHIDANTTTFGVTSNKDIAVKDLVSPPKSRYEILLDDAEFHEMYKKSHQDYYPSEHINRKYNKHFNSDRYMGKSYGYDPSGKCMKCVMKSLNSEPITYQNKIQVDNINRTHFLLSKSLTPNNNINCVPKGHRFGKKAERCAYSVKELLEPGIESSLLKRDYYKAMSNLNEMRMYCKKHNIEFDPIIDSALNSDKERIGWIPFVVLFNIFSYYSLTFNHREIVSLAALFGYFKDGMVKYKEFINMFDVQKELPDCNLIKDKFDHCSHYLTTFRAAELNYLNIDNSKSPPAGVPQSRLDLSRLVKPIGGCSADIDSLGQETTVRALINPSIFTNYGINYLDFLQPQKPKYIRKLFENLGYQFPGDTFSKLWEIGVNIDKSLNVCIETFRKILDQAAPVEILPQSIVACENPKKKCEN